MMIDVDRCLEANSIYASRKGKSKELIVTHSTKSGIPIGTVFIKIDSLVVDHIDYINYTREYIKCVHT